MKTNSTISVLHMVLLFTTATGLKNHVILIPALLNTAGRDAWISVLIAFIVTLIWGMLLFYIYKTINGEHITTWLENNTNQTITRLLGYIVGFYFLMMAATTLKETILWTNASYLLSTPPLVLTIVFLLPCMLAALTNIRTIIITNFFFLGLVIVFGYFVAFTNTPYKDFRLLLPMMEHGYSPVLKAVIYQGSGMVEIFVFLLLQHKFKSEFKYRHFLVIALILTYLTIGPLVGAIVEFGPKQAAMQRYPAYEEWGLARLGSYIEHVDYFSIYQWLTGAFIRITLLLYFTRIILNKPSKKANIWIIITGTIFVGLIVSVPIDERVFFDILNRILLPMTFYFLLGLSFVFTIIAFIVRRKQGGDQHDQQNPK